MLPFVASPRQTWQHLLRKINISLSFAQVEQSMTPSPSTFTASMTLPLFPKKSDRRAKAPDVPSC